MWVFFISSNYLNKLFKISVDMENKICLYEYKIGGTEKREKKRRENLGKPIEFSYPI